MGEQLVAGRVRLLLVADRILLEVQTVVEYLNEQLRAAEVLAVELTRYAGSGRAVLVPRVISRTATARRVKRHGDQRDYQQMLADADPATVELDQRLDELAASHQLVAKTLPRSRQFAGPHGPVLDVLLAPTREAGLNTEADDVLARLNQLTERPLPPKLPGVPTHHVLEHWDHFATELLPELLELRARADQGA